MSNGSLPIRAKIPRQDGEALQGVPPPVSRQPDVVNFGPYEVHVPTQELFKHGSRIKLAPQSFRVLQMLLDHPGQLVTREEFRRTLWQADTFVDFDQGLNTAIKKIRDSLCDSPDTPRYIETLPKLGYRFIGQANGSSQPVPAEPIGLASNGNGSQLPAALAPDSQGPLCATHELDANRLKTWGIDKFAKPAWVVPTLGILLIALIIGFMRKTPLPRVKNWVQITNTGLWKGVVVTDGPRLYFVQSAVEFGSLAQVSTEGGEIAPILLPFKNVELWDISPNKSKLLLGVQSSNPFDGPGELWVLPAAAGAPHRIADVLGQGACWSPNGENIAYANLTGLYFANVDGTHRRELATTSGTPMWCRFSPDGARIRFDVASDVAPPSIWEVTTAGTGLHRLRENACCGSWSADGKYYFFVSGPDGQETIWVTTGRDSTFDDRSVARLTNGPLWAGFFAPSTDGKGLFVVGRQIRGELSRFDVRSKAVASFLDGISAGEVSISPDRKWAAYVSYPEGSLWRSKVDGTERLQLTLPPLQVTEPQWSPNGKQIVFTGLAAGLNIYVVGSEGGNIHQLMPNERAETGSATWSPDGKSIVFVRRNSRESAIYRLNLQSGHVSKVPGSERMYSARTSPTGRYISAIRFSQDSLMLYDVNLGTWSELAHGGNFDCNSWSPDGKFVYVKNRLQDALIIERVRVADHKREQTTVPKVVTTSPWVTVDGDDSVIFTRDASTQQIYRLDLVVPRF